MSRKIFDRSSQTEISTSLLSSTWLTSFNNDRYLSDTCTSLRVEKHRRLLRRTVNCCNLINCWVITVCHDLYMQRWDSQDENWEIWWWKKNTIDHILCPKASRSPDASSFIERPRKSRIGLSIGQLMETCSNILLPDMGVITRICPSFGTKQNRFSSLEILSK